MLRSNQICWRRIKPSAINYVRTLPVTYFLLLVLGLKHTKFNVTAHAQCNNSGFLSAAVAVTYSSAIIKKSSAIRSAEFFEAIACHDSLSPVSALIYPFMGA